MHLNIHRRRFLQIGGLAFGGLRLPELLRAQDKSKSCIVLFQLGGCCQQASWDPKPEAPTDIRGSFTSIPTAIPGVHFGHLLPNCARLANKLAVIRSMRSDVAIHDVAQRYMMSGTRPRNELHHPSYGAVISREFGSKDGLPPYVVIPDRQASAEAGFLGSAFDQFVSGDPKDKNFKVKDVALPDGMTIGEALANRKLLEAIDSEFRGVAKSKVADSMDSFYQQAFDLVSSPATRKAFQIQDEPDKLRDAYARTTVGQGALLARRLIEAGVRLATVYQGGYDTHTDHERGFRRILPEFDAAFSTLITDLEQRGLLDSTLVLAIGEFGRTPKLNPAGGRDHWPGVFSVAMAGAGLPRGLVIGRSDKIAGLPEERPITIEDLGATVYKILGVDYHKTYQGPNRPVPINKDGTPVRELFA